MTLQDAQRDIRQGQNWQQLKPVLCNKRLLRCKFWNHWEVAFLLLKGTEFSKEGSLGDSDGKESTCNEGDPGSIPGSGRSLGEGNGNPPQYSWLKNPMDRGAWWSMVPRVAKSWIRLKQLNTINSTKTIKPVGPAEGLEDLLIQRNSGIQDNVVLSHWCSC